MSSLHYIISEPSDDDRLDSDFPTAIGPFPNDQDAVTWAKNNLAWGTWEYLPEVKEPW